MGYVTPTPPTTVRPKDKKPIPSCSAFSSEWDSDVSVRTLFKELTVNMTSSSQLERAEATDEEPWAQQLDLQWEEQFEQCEPPTEDKVIQVNLGNQDHSKPVFISESLSLTEREELMILLKDYIDVFAWNYKDMPRLDSQVVMHRLNIKPDAKPVKQQQRRFRLNIMKAIEAEVHKLIACGFIREEQHPDWIANIVPVLKKNEKIGSVLTTAILIQLS